MAHSPDGSKEEFDSSIPNWFLCICFQQYNVMGPSKMEPPTNGFCYSPLRWKRWFAGEFVLVQTVIVRLQWFFHIADGTSVCVKSALISVRD
jgi:hypothetical protein